MVIEFSHKEIQEAVLFYYKSVTEYPEDVSTITISEGKNGYCSARLRISGESNVDINHLWG